MNGPVLKQSVLATLTAGLLLASISGVASPGEEVTFRVGEGQKVAAYGPAKPGPVIRFPFASVFLGPYVVVLTPVRCLWSCRGPHPADIRLVP